MKEDGEKDREIQKEKNRENLKEFIDKLEALEISQQRQLEAQKATTKIPLPKYNGEANSLDDWKQAMLICIKGNGWTDEKRIIEMLPSCFTGPAYKIFLSSPCTEETTIESLFLAMTKIFDPNGKTRNRELFLRAKRSPGESMNSFVTRCNQYVQRADETVDISESPWANSFIVEKIYSSMESFDRKLLKSYAGESKDIQMLCKKADELITMGQVAIRSCHYEIKETSWDDHKANHSGQWPYRDKARRHWPVQNWDDDQDYADKQNPRSLPKKLDPGEEEYQEEFQEEEYQEKEEEWQEGEEGCQEREEYLEEYQEECQEGEYQEGEKYQKKGKRQEEEEIHEEEKEAVEDIESTLPKRPDPGENAPRQRAL